MKMTKEQLAEILKLHKMWLNGENGGGGADLRCADLQRADLRCADLRCADLRCADLQRADLRGADLRGADLQRADLRGADLRCADLDLSCLPLWCGGQFKADSRICKQIAAHLLRIMELSSEGSPELLDALAAYKSGWHSESEFAKEGYR